MDARYWCTADLEKDEAGVGHGYMNARYYDNTRGQFLSQDPIFLGDPKSQNLQDPQSFNSYSYAENNPITASDPTGKSIWDSIAGSTNAFGTDFGFGVGRINSSAGNQRDYSYGQNVGDFSALVAGSFISAAGTVAAGVGYGALVPSYGGSAALVAAGTGIATYGATVAGEGSYNLSQRGANNPTVRDAINYGKEQHAQYNPGDDYTLNKAIPGTKLRPDAINVETKTIRELKPDNPNAIQKGLNQLQKYIDAANKTFGGTFKGIIDTYKKS